MKTSRTGLALALAVLSFWQAGELVAQNFAPLPFTDGFEGGSFSSYWVVTGIGTYRSQVTSANTPHGGFYHATMDSSTSASYARNEMTLGLNLAGQANVVLTFWARSFGDEAHGPPPSPFVGGANFDGVAISQDGVNWYEVQSLRGISTTTYTQFTVDLDAAIAARGLAYNSTFRVRFNQYDNSPIGSGDGIVIDDIAVTGTVSGSLHHFALSSVPTYQLVNSPFPVTVTALDGGSQVVSNFNGPVKFWSVLSNALPSSVILGNLAWQVGSSQGPLTVGYSFTPNTNLTLTHVRHFSGIKVSIWTDAGTLVASQEVSGLEGAWRETPLAVPALLLANNTYRVGVYTTNSYYYRNSVDSFTFDHGTINYQYSAIGDAFPYRFPGTSYWPFVDLRYIPQATVIPVVPDTSGIFVDGAWTGSLMLTQTVANVRLHADDGTNHIGEGNLFTVVAADDLALVAGVSAAVLPLGNTVTYTLQVLNPGPDVATDVVLTNLLPASATFISATNSQGSSTLYGNTLVSTLGSLAAGSNAFVSIAVTPTVAGFFTNTAVVTKSGVDPNLADNSAQLVTQVAAMGSLAVTPLTSLSATGIVVGPFIPSNQVYVLSNAGGATLTWSSTKSAAWITRNPTTGALAPGDAVAVTVSINTAAASLGPGSYSDPVGFTNVTTSFGSTTRQVNLTVRSNNLPVANAQIVTTDEDIPATITLQGSDGDGDPLTATITSLPLFGRLYQTTNGTTPGAAIITVPALVNNSLRQVIYRPGTNLYGSGMDAFLFRVSDGRTNSPTAWVTVDVAPVDDPPYAIPDKAATLPGGTTPPFDVTANDSDAEGDFFSLTAYTDPKYGSVNFLGGGWFTYTAGPDFVKGVDEFTYTVSDGLGHSSTGLVSVSVGYLVGGDWPTLGNGPEHTGYYRSSLGANLFTPYWTNTFGGGLNQVVVAKGVVYLTTSQYVLAALDAQSGQLIWQDTFSFGHSMGPPTYDNGRIYFQRVNHNTDSQLRCVDAASGSVLWSSPHGAQWDWYWAPVAVGDGVWIAGGQYNGLYGFDTGDGRQRFFNDYSDVYDVWTPTYYQGVIYSWVAGIFRATNPNSGALQWSLNLPWNSTPYSMNTAVAAWNNRALVMANPYLHAIDLNGQYIIWSATNTFRGTPAVANDVVYCLAYAGFNTEVRAYNFVDGSPSSTFVITNDSGVSGQPMVTDDALLVSSSSATYVFSLQTQQLLQTIPFGGSLSVSDGSLFIANGATLRAYSLGPVMPANDVALKISGLPTNAMVLQPLAYTLAITNSGPALATGLYVTNVLPANASISSIIPSQGTWSSSTGNIVWNLGTLAGGAVATLNINLVPQAAGSFYQTAQLTRAGMDANLFNNRAQVATPVVTPIFINDVSLTEGNLGTNYAVFTVNLGAASSQTITVNYSTSNTTALAGSDYIAQSGTISFTPGSTNQTVSIAVKGETGIEPDEVFFLNLSAPVNAAIADGQGICTILNDDGLPGQLYRFEWSSVATPQYRTEPFVATVTALDISNNIVTSFSGPVSLQLAFGGLNFDFEGPTLPPWTPLNVGSPPGPYELKPFDVRGNGVVSQAFRVAPDSGGQDGITQNILLQAGESYTFDLDLAVANDSGGNNAGVDWGRLSVGGTPLVTTNFGSIGIGEIQRRHVRGVYTPATTGSHAVTINFNRSYTEVAIWAYADDLNIILPALATYYLPLTITLTNGAWSGNITPMYSAQNLSLLADDGSGHVGRSTAFAVLTNHVPVAYAQSVMVTEDTPKAITLTGSDPDGEPLSFSVPLPPTNGVLSGSAPNVSYQPNPDYFGPDNFTFRVDDGKGNLVDALVNLTVAQVTDVAAAQLSIQSGAGNQPQLSLLAEPYERYGIQASTDLVHWVTITNLLPANGPLPFVDPEAPLFHQRFYRAAWLFTPPQLNSPRWLSNHSFELRFPADIGRNYLVLASTNLNSWDTLTNLTATGSNVLFADPAAFNHPQRFYRVRFAP